jgi:hypothetical protein
MWYVTRHSLQGGVRGPRGTHELAEAGTSGCVSEWRGGVDEGLPVPEHIASVVQHNRVQSASRSLLRSLGAQVQGGQNAVGALEGRRSTRTGSGAGNLRERNSLGCWQCGYAPKIITQSSK